jgi:Flp pilus assembly protein TadG
LRRFLDWLIPALQKATDVPWCRNKSWLAALPCGIGPGLSAAATRDSSGSRLSDFSADQAGASAVEFALVAAPFLVILFGILELALIFIVNVSLSLATANFATQLRTGQLQAPGLSVTTSASPQIDLADAKILLCNQMPIVAQATCAQQMQIDVRPLTSFAQTSAAAPISGNTFNSANLCYYSGDAGNVVEIRTWFLYSIIDPLLLAAFSSVQNYLTSGSITVSGNFFPVTTTEIFKSENYTTASNTGAGC